jgi:NADPH-dependent glutamate synthase beta subunit-like oxidoreductase
MAERGVRVVVFEQNPRPYGKIEDGLPRWHERLREKEYAAIIGKLSREGVHYVPNTKIGRDLDFREIVEYWGFNAVILACGAWRDRALPVEGVDEFVGQGLIYQNEFVIAFNHADEESYRGARYTPEDGAIIVGGGLASIDVAKIHTLATTRAKLSERGIEVSIYELETAGIPKTLAKHDLRWEDLGLVGCTVYYRRRLEDMPLMSIPDGATPEQAEKVYRGRQRMLEKATLKFHFEIEPLAGPDGLVVEDGRLVGLRFRRNRVEDGKPIPTDETFERRGPYVVSSIGSIPEAIPGIEMKGELFAFTDWQYGRLAGYPTVFSAGNVVTGKGNIAESRKHAVFVSKQLAEAYLGLGDGDTSADGLPDLAEQVGRATASGVAEHLDGQEPLSVAELEALLVRVRDRQRAVGYNGGLESWLDTVQLH